MSWPTLGVAIASLAADIISCNACRSAHDDDQQAIAKGPAAPHWRDPGCADVLGLPYLFRCGLRGHGSFRAPSGMDPEASYEADAVDGHLHLKTGTGGTFSPAGALKPGMPCSWRAILLHAI